MAIALKSGFKMPIVGLGVWRMDDKDVKPLILEAISIGYRHFDCAAQTLICIAQSIGPLGLIDSVSDTILKLRGFNLKPSDEWSDLGSICALAADYHNEAQVGEALAEAFETGLVKREELFITTKLWNSDHGHVLEACKDSLKNLHLEYLDLYLVHFPIATRHTGVGLTASALDKDDVLDINTTISLETTWHAMEDLVSMGLVRSIGISNYDIFLTRDCLAYSKIKPAVNQIETHPYFQRESLVKFCQKHGITVTAHTPLGGATANHEWFGTVSCLDDPVLKGLAEKYKRTVAQVVLHWGIQRNTIVIPKTSKLDRLKENFQVFDFELSKEDMDLVKSLDWKYRTNNPEKLWGIDLYA